MAPQNLILPPDQSLRKYTNGRRLVILSVADDGFAIGRNTGYPTFKADDFRNGVYLFTENLSVTSDIEAPYGLTAATWSIIGPSSAGRVSIDASGIPGQAGTPSLPNGQPGGGAGALGFFVQDLDDTAANAFTLRARGGGGGDTYNAGARVGDGGDGGVITSVLLPTYRRVLTSVQKFLERQEFRNLTSAVSKADSLYLAANTLLAAAALGLSNSMMTKVFDKLRAEVKEIGNSKESTVENLRGPCAFAVYTLSQLMEDQRMSVAPSPDDVRGGYPGIGINVRVPEGKNGRNGQLRPTFLGGRAPPVANSLVEAQLPFAHPEQCGMLLERANIFFYLGSPPLRYRAKQLYERLIERLSFLPALKSSDPLYQAYHDSKIMPSTWKDDLGRILQSASTQLVHLNSGETDYYGYSAPWAPRANYDFYKAFLDEALKDFASSEDAYIQYSNALTKQDNLTDKVKLASNNAAEMTSKLASDIKDLWSELQDLEGRISAMKSVVERARGELIAAYEAELSRIKKAFGLSIPQIINALTMVAFAPGKAMAALQTGDLLFQGFTSVPRIDGGTVNKEYLASEVRQSEATIAKISFELRKKIDGTYQLDEAYAKRLIVEKEQILSELDKFSKEALGGLNDAETRKALEEKFDATIEAITKRNDLIFRYNVNVQLIQRKDSEKKEYEEKIRQLSNRQVTRYDPDLPAITAYVASIYQSSRLRVMKLLEILVRSLKFRMLDSPSVVAFAFSSDDPRLDLPLSLTSVVLTAARGNIQDEFGKAVEKWGSEPKRFPSKLDNRPGQYVRGKRYYLEREYLEQLVDSHSVAVTIPPALQYAEAPGDFAESCNVRAFRARFGFTGLKVASTVEDGEDVRVQVDLAHGGEDTIVNRSNMEIYFEHDRISTTFSFFTRKDGSMTVLEDGNIADPDLGTVDKANYAAPGPFTEWTISIKHTEFDKLDFSEVTEAYFDFSGTAYTF